MAASAVNKNLPNVKHCNKEYLFSYRHVTLFRQVFVQYLMSIMYANKHVATFINWSLGNSPSLLLVQKNNKPENFSFLATTNWIVSIVRNFFLCYKFPNIPEKSRRGKKTNSKPIAKRYAFQANAKTYLFQSGMKLKLEKKYLR